MTIRYISTRGQAVPLSFKDTVMMGLASDGGLFVPEHVPHFSAEHLSKLKSASYAELAYEVISRFITDGSIPSEGLREIINESYASSGDYAVFRHKEVAPLRKLEDDLYLLELFHGPTLAFKDFALQFLGRLLGYYFSQTTQHATVLGATSGDTGSAAIAGFAGRPNMSIFILHPYNRVSDVQRKQMTTVPDANVHNLAIEGTFDDCQNIVKTLFGYSDFRDRQTLVAVNSINWARIVAQVPYYIYAALKLGAPEKPVSFCVPTGNFGDIYAGYVAKMMGLPVEKLIIATNKNDILKRALDKGVYGMGKVSSTLSPSMDIQVSSNFERLLFDLHGRNATVLATKMHEFESKKKLELSKEAYVKFKKEFEAKSTSDADTLSAIKHVHRKIGILLDPHTAVGYEAAQKCHVKSPVVLLATAHPAKFPDAVQKATGVKPELPEHMRELLSQPERFTVLPNDDTSVMDYIKANNK